MTRDSGLDLREKSKIIKNISVKMVNMAELTETIPFAFWKRKGLSRDVFKNLTLRRLWVIFGFPPVFDGF